MAKNKQPTESQGDFGGEPIDVALRGQAAEEAREDRRPATPSKEGDHPSEAAS